MKNYFTELAEEVVKLDKLAEPYLKGRPEWSLLDIAEKNYELGMEWFKRCGEDFDKVPEVVANIADGWVPFSSPSKNGSIAYSLGLSLKSLEAHAWNLYDFLSGKTQESELPFSLVARAD